MPPRSSFGRPVVVPLKGFRSMEGSFYKWTHRLVVGFLLCAVAGTAAVQVILVQQNLNCCFVNRHNVVPLLVRGKDQRRQVLVPKWAT